MENALLFKIRNKKNLLTTEEIKTQTESKSFYRLVVIKESDDENITSWYPILMIFIDFGFMPLWLTGMWLSNIQVILNLIFSQASLMRNDVLRTGSELIQSSRK